MATFRAGGVTSRINSLRKPDAADEGSGHKTALTRTYFSRNHFSSPLADTIDPMMKRTRVVVKILEGKNLLVSDLLTGTSDPMVLLWVGSGDEGDIDLKQDRRVQSTEVCKHTVDPVWDAEFVFPLTIESIQDVMSGRVNLLVRDRDDADGDIHYVDLGEASISLSTVVTDGNIMAHTQLIQLPARWYSLQPCRRMNKCRGALKIAISFFVGPDSDLLRDEDGDSLGKGESSAARFGRHMKKFRAGRGSSGRARPASMSPPHRTTSSARELTVRGGTTFLRPKSAPEATTLASPLHLRERPFQLKPVHPRFPAKGVEAADPTQHNVAGCWKTQSPATHVADTAAASEVRPRWRDTFFPSQGQPVEPNAISSLAGFGRCATDQARSESEDASLPVASSGRSSQVATHAKPNPKLSRLAADATRGTTSRGGPPGSSIGWQEEGGAIARAHRWQRRLLESMQRLEDRSTEVAAYGELRAMAREASLVQVGQVVAAARSIGRSSSLSARRRILRLLAWLCWDQPLAASRYYSGIIAHVIERIHDDETASLRDDLAACVGAVMLSALRDGTAEACMVQTRRFLRLVGEQRLQVRESAGVCCVASVRPSFPHVPLEAETGTGGIDDVRLAIGQAAERGGIPNAVPKDLILLPGGRAVIELADAEIAASFVDRMAVTVTGLLSSWRLCPFPEDFCARASRAQAAHHNKVTVYSEEILASLLEALSNGRSQATRSYLFKAMVAMADSCVVHAEGGQSPATLMNSTVAAEMREPRGMVATLKKGLPAIVRAVLEVLECPVRRVYTWKEREAALEVITSLAVLVDLRGVEGPLGEYRAKLIQGATKGKHDSVAAVRKAASESLSVLQATDAEKQRRASHAFVPGRARMAFKWSGSGAATAATAATHQAGKRRLSGDVGKAVACKTLDGALKKAERREIAAADVRQHASQESQDSRDVDQEPILHRQEEMVESASQLKTRGILTSSIFSKQVIKMPIRDIEQQDRPRSSRGSLEKVPGAVRHDDVQKRDADKADCPQRENDTSDDTNGGVPQTNDDEGGVPEKEAGTPTPMEREVKRVPIEVMVTSAVQQLSQSQLPPTVTEVESSRRCAELSDKHGCTGSTEKRARTEIPSALPPPMVDDGQATTIRLLTHLNGTTKKIVRVLHGLNQRLRQIEPKLMSQERLLHSDESPTSSPPPRKLKRRRSSRTMGSAKSTCPSRRETPNSASGRDADKRSLDPAGGGGSQPPTRRRTRLTRDIKRCLDVGDVESAFRAVLNSGTEREVLRLMGIAGGPDLCRQRLGMETRDRLFAFVARTISGGRCIEHVLPWVFELVRAGEAKTLSLAVRMQLAGALHGLAASPTDEGIMAARLGPYLSLVSVGRSSMSDAAVGGGVFAGMGLAAGGP
ncbi:unnamed protein product [Scytosiphon promiscuus]